MILTDKIIITNTERRLSKYGTTAGCSCRLVSFIEPSLSDPGHSGGIPHNDPGLRKAIAIARPSRSHWRLKCGAVHRGFRSRRQRQPPNGRSGHQFVVPFRCASPSRLEQTRYLMFLFCFQVNCSSETHQACGGRNCLGIRRLHQPALFHFSIQRQQNHLHHQGRKNCRLRRWLKARRRAFT